MISAQTSDLQNRTLLRAANVQPNPRISMEIGGQWRNVRFP